MKLLKRLVRYGLLAIVSLTVLGGLATLAAYLYLSPDLPSAETMKDIKLQVPLRIYTKDGQLMAEFGETKRLPLQYDQIPEKVIQSFLSAEDDRFFEHPGVDYQGLIRAVVYLLRTGEKGQGGSTITMQLARNVFFTSEKTYRRKISEIFLALKIEQEFTKEEILTLYLNKIFLGQRAYGVGAAAQVYYGLDLDQLTTAQYAMIAGLPKAPSTFNPIVNPDRALIRRNYVLGRMRELDFIDEAEYQKALAEPITASLHAQTVEVEAPYVAEMIRAEVVERYGEQVYNDGFKAYATIDGRLQGAANKALRRALLEYDRRHGYRGPEGRAELDKDADAETYAKALAGYGLVGELMPALVISVEDKGASLYTADGQTVKLELEGLKWARKYISVGGMGAAPKKASDVLKRGDIVRLERAADDTWVLAQVPDVAGALVSLRPNDGALLALTGGFDFFKSKFNRVTQAQRQPGSNFKPFIYSAALDSGFTTASLINDAPVVFEDPSLEAEWRPENYSGKFFGPTRLREALVRSRNLVSIRLLQSVGIPFALEHVAKFGFDPERLPRNLSLALGSASITPWELVRGYAVLANGGYLIEPYYIERVEDGNGNVLEQSSPLVACDAPCDANTVHTEQVMEEQAEDTQQFRKASAPTIERADTTGEILRVEAQPAELAKPDIQLAPRTVSAQNIYLVTSMMQDVVRRGTGHRAYRELGRNDLAGKTGTTNEQRDAWFSGFNRDITATAWVGFDTPRPLGRAETGAGAALPMWIYYMAEALKDRPENAMEQPPGMATVRIDPETGKLAPADSSDAIFEIFRADNVPTEIADESLMPAGDANEVGGFSGQLF